MSWNCEHIEARLSDYVDQLLSLEEQREFTDHAATCAKCKALVAGVTGFVIHMRHLEPVAEPTGLAQRILEQTLGPRKTVRGWRAVLEWLRPVVQPRFAMGLAVVVLGFVMVSQSLGVQWSQIKAEDLKPANVMRTANSQAHLIYARGVKFFNDLRVVYEIQTRLGAPQQPEPQPPAAKPQTPGSTEAAPEKRDRDINRADELKNKWILLASAVPGEAGRSVR